MSQLSEFLKQRLTTDGVLHKEDPNSPPWWEEGVTVEVNEDSYFEYLDMLAPRYISGSLFAFGEGSGNFTLFWEEGDKHYAHHLSPVDTERFCKLTGVSLHQ